MTPPYSKKHKPLRLLTVLTIQLLVVFFYLGMEWLFFVTKASFMSSIPIESTIAVLFITPVLVGLATFPLVLMFRLLDQLLPKLHSQLLIPTFFLASSVLLLIDNFLYTLFKTGIITSLGHQKTIYLLLFIVLLALSFHWLRSVAKHLADRNSRKWPFYVTRSLLATALVATGVEFLTTDFSRAYPNVKFKDKGVVLPNIIFLSSDGVEARFTSVYGSQFATTPFLKDFAAKALVFENAFPSSGKTTGSLSSMLTGSPTYETHVGFPPHVFSRKDAALHLPSMLQSLGYKGFQSSVRYYADAGDLNMFNSFDLANGRALLTPDYQSAIGLLTYMGNAEHQFLTRMASRLSERLMHIFGVRPIVNHFLLVTKGKNSALDVDSNNLKSAILFATEQNQPFFMQVHLMATHCCKYTSTNSYFKAAQVRGRTKKKRKQMAAYLNSIRDMDSLYRSFISKLDEAGILENTVIVVASDHSQKWDSVQRVPLIIRFPYSQYQGRIERNVSLTQLPATILEYMGIEKPAWMSQGLLVPESDFKKGDGDISAVGDAPPIISLASFNYQQFKLPGGHLSKIQNPGPPIYGVREAGLVIGSHWMKLNLLTGKLRKGNIKGHTQTNWSEPLPSDKYVRQLIVKELEQSGFQIPLSSWIEPLNIEDPTQNLPAVEP